MLEIKPVQEKTEHERICARCGMHYDADLLMYAAYVDGALVGASEFGMNHNGGFIYDLRNTPQSDDRDALFIMGRQTLNFIDLCGVHKATFLPQDVSYEVLAKQIGFRKLDSGEWFMNLEGFFTAPCQHDLDKD